MKRGYKTDYAGVHRTDTGWHVMATATVNGTRLYRERTITGKEIKHALWAQDELKAELAKEVEARKVSGNGTDLFGAFEKAWIAYLKSTDTKPSTIATYQEKMKSHVLPYWKDVRVSELQPKRITEYLMWLSKNQSHYAKETLHSAWRAFKACVAWTCTQLNINESPTSNVRFKVKAKAATAKPTLSGEELTALVSNLGVVDEPYRTSILLMATTGARVGEITALRWSEIDLGAGWLVIKRSNTRGVVSESTKTGKARVVPLAAAAKESLEKLKADGAGADGGLIFKSGVGTPLRAKAFIAPLTKVRKAAGIEHHISPHAFRRAVNDALRLGTKAGEATARAILGHMSPGMTINYATVQQAEARAAMEGAGVLDMTVNPVGFAVGVEKPVEPERAKGVSKDELKQ